MDEDGDSSEDMITYGGGNGDDERGGERGGERECVCVKER